MTLRKNFEKLYDSRNIGILKKQFVEPYLQETNPANTVSANNELPTVKVKFNEFYRQFINPNIAVNSHGGNCIFILADAGMGKTALATMIFDKSLRKGHIYPNKVHYLKLGIDTIDNLNLIESPGNVTVILDALDEDSLAFGRYEQRITDLLRISCKFYRCIITCRTQFFPDRSTNITSTRGHMRVSGYVQFGQYICRVYYLSPFDDLQIDEYLKKFFKFKSPVKIANARKVVASIGDMSSRPLILSYIDILSGMKISGSNENEAYEKIISFWLSREIEKEAMVKRKIDYGELLKAISIVAEFMVINRCVILKKDQLYKLSQKIEKVSSINFIDVSGRTLLQKDHDGHYMFAHRSFLEYLVSATIVSSVRVFKDRKIPVSDKMLFFLTHSAYGEIRFSYTNLVFSDLKIYEINKLCFNFLFCDFDGVTFTEELNKVRFSHCKFTNCKFDVPINFKEIGGIFENCEFVDADIP